MNLFIPQNFKYKKTFRPRISKNVGTFSKLNKMSKGRFGFKAITTGLMKSIHLEAIRKVLNKFLKKEGFFFFRIFPNRTMTKKPLEVRMGKGKGNVDCWVFPVKIGSIFVEMDGVSNQKAVEIFDLCKAKLPLLIKLVKNDIDKDSR